MRNDITIDTNVFIFAESDFDCATLILEVYNKKMCVCVDYEYQILGEYQRYIDEINGISKVFLKHLLSGKCKHIKYITKKLCKNHSDYLITNGFDKSDIKFVRAAYHSSSKLLVSNESDFCTVETDRLSPEYIECISTYFKDTLALNVANCTDAISQIR